MIENFMKKFPAHTGAALPYKKWVLGALGRMNEVLDIMDVQLAANPPTPPP